VLEVLLLLLSPCRGDIMYCDRVVYDWLGCEVAIGWRYYFLVSWCHVPEAHPQEAKRIADAGTDFMRELGTPQGFGKL